MFQVPGTGIVAWSLRSPGYMRSGAGAGVRAGRTVSELTGHHHLCRGGSAPGHLRVSVTVQI